MVAAQHDTASVSHGHERQSLPLLLIAHLIAIGLTAIPLCAADIPAIADYPNHLARMHILSTLDESPELQQLYRVEWAFLPNLAMDLMVPWLGQFTGVEPAARLFLAAAIMSIAIGTTLLHRAVHGRLGYWPLVIYLFLYNGVLNYGFLNYIFGIGLALALLSLWIASSDTKAWWRLPLFAVGALILYFSHLAAIATFALCLSTFEFWRWHKTGKQSIAALLGAAAKIGLLLAPSLLCLAFLASTPSGQADVRYELQAGKLVALLVPVNALDEPIDLLLAAFVIILAVIGFRRSWFRFAGSLALPTCAMAIAILLVPTWLYDNWGNDVRLAVPVMALLIAGTRLCCSSHHLVRIGFFAAVTLIARNVSVAADWSFHDSLYKEFRVAATTMPSSSRILTAMDIKAAQGPESHKYFQRALYHTATLALLDQPVFVPTLFTAPGRQVLTVQAEYEELDVPHSRPLPVRVLKLFTNPDFDESELNWSEDVDHFRRFVDWSENYDYVLVLDFGEHSNPLPETLKPAETGSYFTLYEIEGDS